RDMAPLYQATPLEAGMRRALRSSARRGTMRASRRRTERSMVEVRRYADARAFLERAEPWLLEAEIEHAVVLTSAQQARIDDRNYERPIYWATLEQDGEIVGCACRTPPYKVGVTRLPDAAIAPLIADLDAT